NRAASPASSTATPPEPCELAPLNRTTSGFRTQVRRKSDDSGDVRVVDGHDVAIGIGRGERVVNAALRDLADVDAEVGPGRVRGVEVVDHQVEGCVAGVGGAGYQHEV